MNQNTILKNFRNQDSTDSLISRQIAVDIINNKLDGIPLKKCTNINGSYDIQNVKIYWTDPEDDIIDPTTGGIIPVKWDKTVLVRKLRSYPTNINDGTIVVTSEVKNQYTANNPFICNIDNYEHKYYYKLFSISKNGIVNNLSDNQFVLTNNISWNDIHTIIQSGQAQDYFELGDVLTTNHSEYGEIQWQIVAFDQAETVDTSIQHSITLLSLNCLEEAIVFDCPESSGAPNYRNQFGYNKWSESNIRQWLNSNGSANNWFTPQNEYDLCSYSNIDGFMKGFTDSNFLNCLTTVKNITTLNTVDAGGGYEITEDTFFLPSKNEISDSQGSIIEGVYWIEIFPNNNSRIKYYNNSVGYWWLRSPHPGNAYNVGSVNYYGIWNTHAGACSDIIGLVPACVIV